MTLQEHLSAAADYIERYGWAQTWRGRRGDPACILKAIDFSYGLSDFRDREAAYIEVAQRVGVPRWEALGTWNDAKGRTKEEVLTALRGPAS